MLGQVNLLHHFPSCKGTVNQEGFMDHLAFIQFTIKHLFSDCFALPLRNTMMNTMGVSVLKNSVSGVNNQGNQQVAIQSHKCWVTMKGGVGERTW